MSLSKEALDTITATAIAASGAPLDTHVPAILIPSGYSLKSTEHLQARPARFRGTFNTHAIDAFAQYVEQHASENQSAGFIDADDMAARVIFDLGTDEYPGHAEHTATLKLKPTAPLTAASNIVTGTLSQRGLSEWLEDWAPHLTPRAQDGKSITLPAAIDAIRRMRIETKGARENEIGDLNTKRSALEEIEAKSQGTLPFALVFHLIPYEGIAPIDVILRLSTLTGEDTPKFRLRWMQQERQIEQIASQFCELLNAKLGDTLPLTLGTFTK